MSKPQIGDIYKYSGTKSGYWTYAKVTGIAGPSSFKIGFSHSPENVESTVVWTVSHFEVYTHYTLAESCRVRKILENYD